MVTQLRTCCCGCSLRTGTRIIGWCSMVGALCTIALGLMGAVACVVGLERGKGQQKAPSNVHRSNGAPDGLEQNMYVLVGVTVFLLSVGIIQAVVSGMLLHGVNKERPRLIKPWIVYSIFEIVLQCIAVLVNIGSSFANGQTDAGLLQLLIWPFLISIAVYYVLVVNSYRRELIVSSMSSKM